MAAGVRRCEKCGVYKVGVLEVERAGRPMQMCAACRGITFGLAATERERKALPASEPLVMVMKDGAVAYEPDAAEVIRLRGLGVVWEECPTEH